MSRRLSIFGQESCDDMGPGGRFNRGVNIYGPVERRRWWVGVECKGIYRGGEFVEYKENTRG